MSTALPVEPTQSRYEVRFDWGLAGLASIAPGAGAIVLVDALDEPDGADAASAVREAAAGYGVPVFEARLGDRTAAARAVLALQEALGRRAMVAVVAAGGVRSDGSPRVAVEDQLAAGAVIDALAGLGIDFCSPEAAAAAASFTGLQRALGHLLTASVSGQGLPADSVRASARIDVA